MSRATWTFLVCTAWALFGLGAARAQDKYLKEPRPFRGERIETLKAGLVAEGAPNAAQTEAAEICARYLVYRFTDPSLGKLTTQPGKVRHLMDDYEHWLRQVFLSKDMAVNPQMQAVFRDKLLEALGHVLASDQQQAITRVNAVRALARLAKDSGHAETSGLLLKVLNDPKQIDGARYWAIKGLKELLLRDSQKAPAARMGAKQREQIAAALVQFIERTPNLEKDAPEEELNGLRVMRREAVRALAFLPEPQFAGNPKAHTALALLRVLRKDKELVPEPRLDEQLEAAIGLASLRADASYQPGYTAYHLAHFLKEFADQYLNRGNPPYREPWRVHGARLHDAFRAMQAAFPNDPTVKAVTPFGVALGKAMEKVPAEAGTADAGTARTAADKWLNANPQPPVASVYKGDAKAVVTPRAAEAP